MSLPLPSYDPVSRANWLGRYLAVERNFDKQLNSVLKDSLSGIDEAFAKHNRNFSDQVRRVQLSQSRRALRDVIGSIFGSTGNLIRNNRQDAAVAAIDAGLFDERSILARIFTNPVARKAYAQSLRQSGRRNIESVMTRVLETEIPLSKRVYKSQALANGMVGRTINRALARGDSFKDLARDVTALIDPAVPGGVSYAARRLGRTEINNAFHAQSIHDAQEHPWIQEMEWHLSKVHVTDPGDECELYAIQKDFSVERVPVKPHPHCRCYVTPKLPDYDQFETALVSGQYDSYLNKVLGFDEDSAAIIDMGGLGTKAGPDYSVKPISTKVVGIDSGSWQDSPNHTALIYRFQQKWMGDPLISTDNLQLVNFTPENVGLEDAKRMLAAVDDKLTKYPQAQGNLKQVVLGWGEDSEYARTIRDADGRSIIKFNLNWSRDHDSFYKHVKDNVAEGFHPANTDLDPYYDMVTHEFGHVLDNVGYHRARDEVKWISLEVHKDLNTGVRYHKWLAKGAPSHYSIAGGELGGSLNSTEALAEAFLDVERNGAAAKPLSKALARKLIDESKSKATDVDEIMRLMAPQIFPSTTGEVVVKPVVWTGPKIAMPSYGGDVAKHVDLTWGSTRFDEFKDYMREGAREAQLNGYDGFGIQAKDLTWNFGRMDVDPDTLREEGKELLARAVHAKPTEEPLYRGMLLTQDQIDELVNSTSMSMPLSSFGDINTATSFNLPERFWHSTDIDKPDELKPFMIQLEPGAKVAPVLNRSEFVAQGKFDIVKVLEPRHIRWLPPEFDYGDPTDFEDYAITLDLPRTIVIRQTSMIEKGVGHSSTPLAVKSKGAPDISLVGLSKADQKAAIAKRKAVEYFDSVGTKLDFFYDDDAYPPTTFTQLIGAHKKLHTQFPEVNIEQITFDDLPSNSLGQTFGSFPRADRPFDDQTITSEIVLNRQDAKHPDMWKFWAQRDEEKGWHPPGSGTSPVTSTYTHEFGHAFINALGENADDLMDFKGTMDELREAYTAEAGSFNPTKFNKWVREGLSGYSFETQKAMQKGIPLLREAYPEAFDAVQRLGNKASEPVKVLYNRMIDRFNQMYRPEGHSIRSRVVDTVTSVAPKAKIGPKVVDIIDVLAGDETPTSFDNYGSVNDIARVLNDFFGIQMDTDIDMPYAWNDETTSLEAMKALGNQYLSLHEKFPHIDIQRLDNVDMIDDAIATTYPNLTGSYMEWNRRYMLEPQILSIADKADPTFHPLGSDILPVEHSMTHEFGHAIVNFTNSYQPGNLEFMDIHRELFNAYKAELETTGKKDTPTAFRRWMHKNLSGYSFEIDPYSNKITDVLQPDEAIAEAFDDVFMNGDKARKGSRVINDYVMRWHDAALKDRDKRHKARINVLKKQIEGKGK